MRPEARTLVLLAALLLAACGRSVAPEPAGGGPAPLPVDDYAQAARAGASVFRLEPEHSRIDVVVRREGPLARLGHDHVMVARALEGYAAASSGGARADLRVDLEALAVDPPDARARHGLETRPDAEDVAATRRNMLDATLRTATWPWAAIAVRAPSAPQEGELRAEFTIDLHGHRRSLAAPVQVEHDAGNVTVRARFDLSQRAFGIEPFSALGGSLRVADTVELHATLRFRPVDEAALAGGGAGRGGMHAGPWSE